jgi:hypothetical protein
MLCSGVVIISVFSREYFVAVWSIVLPVSSFLRLQPDAADLALAASPHDLRHVSDRNGLAECCIWVDYRLSTLAAFDLDIIFRPAHEIPILPSVSSGFCLPQNRRLPLDQITDFQRQRPPRLNEPPFCTKTHQNPQNHTSYNLTKTSRLTFKLKTLTDLKVFYKIICLYLCI